MLLEQVKPGDIVVEHTGISGLAIRQVDKVTATQVVLTTGQRYLRRSGRRVGDAERFFPNRITAESPEKLDKIREEIRAATIRQEIDRLVQSRLRPSNLRQMSPELLENIREYLSDLPVNVPEL